MRLILIIIYFTMPFWPKIVKKIYILIHIKFLKKILMCKTHKPMVKF